MKRKVQDQLQPRQTGPGNAQVQLEIKNFLQAIDSYPARAAKEPDVTFQQHLCSIFVGGEDRRGNRPSRD
ncbi:MAG TPA: hypothetical protein VNX26_18065 [Candidatus Acidoferrum sp.]|jgi:hypothetical protein|nr:hypothetical protein [Candidatus Acidoferrum sp.]